MRDWIIGQLEKLALKTLMKKLFGAVLGGVQGFLVTFLFGRVWKQWVRPLLMWAWRKAVILSKRPARRKQAEELFKAEDEKAILDAINNLD